MNTNIHNRTEACSIIAQVSFLNVSYTNMPVSRNITLHADARTGDVISARLPAKHECWLILLHRFGAPSRYWNTQINNTNANCGPEFSEIKYINVTSLQYTHSHTHKMHIFYGMLEWISYNYTSLRWFSTSLANVNVLYTMYHRIYIMRTILIFFFVTALFFFFLTAYFCCSPLQPLFVKGRTTIEQQRK